MEERKDILARAEELGHAAGVRLAQERADLIGDPHKARDILEGAWWGQEPWPSSHGLVSVPGDYVHPDRFAAVHELGMITDDELATLRAAEAQHQAAVATIKAIMGDGNPSPDWAFRTVAHVCERAFVDAVEAQAYAVFGGEAAFAEMKYREEAAQIVVEKGLEGAAAEAFIAQHVADLKAEGERATPPSGRAAAVSDDVPPHGISPERWANMPLETQAALRNIHAHGVSG